MSVVESLPVPDDIRNRVYQPNKRFTTRFADTFIQQLTTYRPAFTPSDEGFIIRLNTINDDLGGILLTGQDPTMRIEIILGNGDDENLREDVRLSIRGAFDSLRAQNGGKRKSRKSKTRSRKSRKTRKGRK